MGAMHSLSPIQLAMGLPWIEGRHFKQYVLGTGTVSYLGEFVEKAKSELVTTGFWIFKKEKEVWPEPGTCYVERTDFIYLDEQNNWRRISANDEKIILPN